MQTDRQNLPLTPRLGRSSPLALATAALCTCVVAKGAPALVVDGHLDVWALRNEIQAVANLRRTSMKAVCSEPPTKDDAAELPADTARQQRSLKACRAQAQRLRDGYDIARQRLNQVWGPALRAAMSAGDDIAEVILRQCRSTAELDRSDLESTCDPDWVRQQVASKRLREIGFVPGMVVEPRRPADAGPSVKSAAQLQALERFAAGDFSQHDLDTNMGGNVAHSPDQLADYRRWYAIDTLQARVWRAFSIDLEMAPLSRQLSLGRADEHVDDPIWGTDYNIGNSGGTLPHDETQRERQVYLDVPPRRTREHIVGGLRDASFLQLVTETLTASLASMDDWLRRDARWGVFERQRISHVEWAARGQPSTTGQLEPAWAGRYTLVRAFDDFLEVPVAPGAIALVGSVAGNFRIQWPRDPASGADANCMLRYSGGSSYRPYSKTHEAEITDTVLGYLPNLTRRLSVHDPGPVAPFAPMDARQRYRQVLVQCPQGEWPGQRQVRMLYLAGDTLVEIFRPMGRDSTVQVRHWRRVVSTAAMRPELALTPTPNPSLADMMQAHQTALETLRQHAAGARAEQTRWDQATTEQLLAMLTYSRIEERTYGRDRFPKNVKLLEVRGGIVPAVCRNFETNPADPLVRFNLVALLAMQLKDGTAAKDAPVAADCLHHALTDLHPWVRGEAAWGLGFARRTQDLEALHPLLNDADPQVREHAQQSIQGPTR